MVSFINYAFHPILGNYKLSKSQVLDFLFSLIPSIILLFFLRNEVMLLFNKEDNSYTTLSVKWSIIGFVTSLSLLLLYKAYTYSTGKRFMYYPTGILNSVLSIVMYIIFFLGIFLSLPTLTVIFFFYFLLIVMKEIFVKKSILNSHYILYLFGMGLPIHFFFGTLIFKVNYFDGKYCTTVTIESVNNYREYDLTVEVSDNKLVRIYFPNRGWLDKTHFVSKTVRIDRDGYCSFKDDRGREIYFFLSENEKGSCN